MKSLPRVLRTVAILAGVFALGVLFDRYAVPFLSHEVWVWGIQGVEGRGCEGATQATSFRFGSTVDWADGVYKIPCNEFGYASETAALLCRCRDMTLQ